MRGVGWDKRTIREADGLTRGSPSVQSNAQRATAPGPPECVLHPGTAHPTANAGVRMRRLSNGNSDPGGPALALSWFLPRLVNHTFRGSIPLRYSACPTLRMRGVGWDKRTIREAAGLTRGSPSVQSNAQRARPGPPEGVLHPGDRASHGKRWFSDAPFVKWKPDPGGPASLSCGSCRDLLTILFRGSILTPLFRLSHPTDARRRVGQAIHHGGRWTDEGVSIRAVECATRKQRPAHRNACSIPETAHPRQTLLFGCAVCQMETGSWWAGDSLSRGSCRDLLTILFRGSILTPLFRLSHPTDARRRVGQAIHHGGRWTDEGVSIRAVKCATHNAPAHRNACSIPETAHPTANAAFRMRRLSNGNRILVGRRSLSRGSCRDLLTILFRGSILTPLFRLSHPTDARRRVGQAIHHGGRWTDEGVSIRAVECATRDERGPPECVLHPGDRHPTANAAFRMHRLSNGNRILVGRHSLSRGSCRDLLTILFRGSILTPLFRLSHPTDARRRVGQAIHHGGRWTDEGVSIRAVEMRNAQRATAHRNACSIPETAQSHGKRWFSDAPFVKWKPDPGGPASLSRGSCRDLLTILFRGSILTPLFRLSHPTDARRRVGQAIHHGDRWTDEGVSIRAVECATRDERRPTGMRAPSRRPRIPRQTLVFGCAVCQMETGSWWAVLRSLVVPAATC